MYKIYVKSSFLTLFSIIVIFIINVTSITDCYKYNSSKLRFFYKKNINYFNRTSVSFISMTIHNLNKLVRDKCIV